jgi:microcystin-dependent protein
MPSDNFVAELSIFACNFAPVGYQMCNGQILPISQNTALFSLLGTNFGGNGTSNFALPNLQGSSPIGFGQGPGLTNRNVGEVGGVETVTLNVNQIPAHAHQLNAYGLAANADAPSPQALLGLQRDNAYNAGAPGTLVAMESDTLAHSGGNLPHDNRPPYLSLNLCISITGVFPSRP